MYIHQKENVYHIFILKVVKSCCSKLFWKHDRRYWPICKGLQSLLNSSVLSSRIKRSSKEFCIVTGCIGWLWTWWCRFCSDIIVIYHWCQWDVTRASWIDSEKTVEPVTDRKLREIIAAPFGYFRAAKETLHLPIASRIIKARLRETCRVIRWPDAERLQSILFDLHLREISQLLSVISTLRYRWNATLKYAYKYNSQ